MGTARDAGTPSGSDTVEQIHGLEGRLEQAWRAGALARVAALVSAAIFAAETLGALLGAFDWKVGRWIFLVATLSLALSLVLVIWRRLWIKESREPFRYTYSVARFEGTPDSDDVQLARVGAWLRRDLTIRLSQRIKRLELLPEEQIPGDTPAQPAAHIHVSGTYGMRERADIRVIEIVPEVRIGSERCPSTLGHPARFAIMGGVAALEEADSPAYDQLLERVYYSVATEIYKQIRIDVERKIARLPTPYLRATAYFHEAQDYARSNTLDAFDAAKDLYDAAIKLYDRRRRSLPPRRWQRPLQHLLASLAPRIGNAKIRVSHVVPRAARAEVMAARAEIGYATMLVVRRTLATLSGRGANPIFEAHRVACSAVQRLRRIPEGVPDREATLFSAYVALAYARSYVGDSKGAADALEVARRLDPANASERPFFLYVAGEIEPHLLRKIRLLRRAVELDPQFVIAHFQLAHATELLWRRRQDVGGDLEERVAGAVFEEYETVAKLDPGNLGAWANLGYLHWLLWDPDTGPDPDAPGSPAEAFEYGRLYKQIKQETVVAELDYGLARLYAEAGRFREAYEYYVKAVSAGLAEPQEPVASGYYFDDISDAMLRRFRRYRQRVEEHLDGGAGADVPPRVREAVRAFVLTDFGDACAAYSRRSNDDAVQDQAVAAFTAAADPNPNYVLAPYFHAQVASNLDASIALTRRALDLEPEWEPALLQLASYELNAAQGKPEAEASRHRTEAEEALRRLIRADCLETLAKRARGERAGPVLADWERELMDHQAQALLQWIRLLSLAAPEPDPALTLAEFVSDHFLPGDWLILVLRRDLARASARRNGDPGARARALAILEDAEERLGFVVRYQVERDPASWSWLGELDDVSLPGGGARRSAIRRAAARAGNAPPEVIMGMAWRLANAGEHEAAARAYLRLACASDSHGDRAPMAAKRVFVHAHEFFQVDAEMERMLEVAAGAGAGVVSAAAASCLAQLRAGRNDVDGAESALRLIGDDWPEPADHATAAVAAALARRGRSDDAEALLRERIAGSVERAGASAVELARQLHGRNFVEEEELLRGAVGADDPVARRKAIDECVRFLWFRDDADGAHSIVDGIVDADTALAAADVAYSYGWDDSADALLRLALTDPDVAERAALALIERAAPRGIDALLVALEVVTEDAKTARAARRVIRSGRAEHLVPELMRVEPEEPGARYLVAEAFARSAARVRAIELLRGSDLDAGELAPALLVALGDHLAAEQSYSDAADAYRKAIRVGDYDDREAWDGLVSVREAGRRGARVPLLEGWRSSEPPPSRLRRLRGRLRPRPAPSAQTEVPGAAVLHI